MHSIYYKKFPNKKDKYKCIITLILTPFNKDHLCLKEMSNELDKYWKFILNGTLTLVKTQLWFYQEKYNLKLIIFLTNENNSNED
jgi:predicted metalloenzyme YecM